MIEQEAISLSEPCKPGEPTRTRTGDPFITKEVLQSASSLHRRLLTGAQTGASAQKSLQIGIFETVSKTVIRR
jgi:hypothetical protein